MRRVRQTPAPCHRFSYRGALCVGVILLVTGCQSGSSGFPEDHERLERIIKVVEALRVAYENRDRQAFQALRSPSPDIDRLARDVETDFSAYVAIVLNVTIERMSIQGEQATVNIRWEGEWRRALEESEEALRTDRGHGVLVLSGREVVLLERVAGNLPFGIANR